MAVKEIERAKFNVNRAISLFLRAFESESLPTFIKNGEIGVSCGDKITSIET